LLTAAVVPKTGIPVLNKPYRPLELLQHIDALLKAPAIDSTGGE
jgi:hypothetical protein